MGACTVATSDTSNVSQDIKKDKDEGPFCSIELKKRDNGQFKKVFEHDTFGGNGRTCTTCHPSSDAFTVSPATAQQRYLDNPNDPLFLADGTDDGQGNGVNRMLTDATILVNRALPSWLSVVGSSQTSITVARGIPTLFDIAVEANFPAPGTPAIMLDGRNANLQEQAAGAIAAHFQPTEAPTEEQLENVEAYQASSEFFTTPDMADVACAGLVPDLPQGNTDSEKRGRQFFVPKPQPPFTTTGTPQHFDCSTCHSGPLLNEVMFAPNNATHPNGVVPNGQRFMDSVVGINARPEDLMTMIVRSIDTPGQSIQIVTPDPGRALVQGMTGPGCTACTTTSITHFRTCGRCLPCSNLVQFNSAYAPYADDHHICGVLQSDVVDAFKIPSLRGISRTAPYFHDNSAKTLEEAVEHYVDFFEFHFQRSNGTVDGRLSAQDVEDIVAYLRLL